jgi:NADH dehydrogenase (ubiquinone) flavoprotein 1
VQDPPVRHYGGLKDQDRIFTNIHSRHDHGIKGAMVRLLRRFACAAMTNRV